MAFDEFNGDDEDGNNEGSETTELPDVVEGSDQLIAEQGEILVTVSGSASEATKNLVANAIAQELEFQEFTSVAVLNSIGEPVPFREDGAPFTMMDWVREKAPNLFSVPIAVKVDGN